MLEALVISNLILWVVVVFLGVLAFALVRQIGVLYERVAPAGALMLNQTLRPGEAAPELDVLTMAGKTLHIGGPRDPARLRRVSVISASRRVCRPLPVSASKRALLAKLAPWRLCNNGVQPRLFSGGSVNEKDPASGQAYDILRRLCDMGGTGKKNEEKRPVQRSAPWAFLRKSPGVS